MIGLDLFVVIYRRRILEAETLISLRKLNLTNLGFSANVYIWDNSPEFDESSQYSLPPNWHYIHEPKNPSLSIVYNTLLQRSAQPYVMILDQDSVLGTNLFSHLHDSVTRVLADIYVPVIEHAGKVISPGKLVWIKGSHIHPLQRNAILPKNFTAMMSGLCVKRDFFAGLSSKPFDERLRFYGVDTKFCRDASAQGAKAYIYDAVLPHDSALRNVSTQLDRIERHVWLWQSWLHVFDRNILEAVAIRLYIAFKIICATGRSDKYTLRELFEKVYR